MELRKCKIAEMIDFFTKPLFKNDQNQPHKGGSLEARKPLNKMNVSPPLNKVSGFLGLQCWWLNSFLNSLSNLIHAFITERNYPQIIMNDLTPQNKVFGSERLRFCLEP